MNPNENISLHVLHVASAFLLVGCTFYAFAGPPETRKKILAWSGVFSLLAVATGLRLWQGLYGFHGGWAIVKLVCWLGLSAIAGMAYRKRDRVHLLLLVTVVLAVTAIAMVYVKPF
jgi:hypothetical protein